MIWSYSLLNLPVIPCLIYAKSVGLLWMSVLELSIDPLKSSHGVSNIFYLKKTCSINVKPNTFILYNLITTDINF